MRTRSVFALFLACSPLIVGCSGGGNSSPAFPQAEPPAVFSRSAGADAAVGAGGAAPATTVVTGTALPSDFPAKARPGAQQRLASAQWAVGTSATPVLSLSGPGAAGAKAFAYVRAQRTLAVAVYVPAQLAVPTGTLTVHLGVTVVLPFESTSNDNGTWSDTRPALAAAQTFSFGPARALLIALKDGALAPSPSPTGLGSADVSSCVHFVTNPVCRQLPAHPSVSPYSAAWAAVEFQTGHNGMTGFNAQVGPHPFSDSEDQSDPPLDVLAPGDASIAQVIVCDQASWGAWACGKSGLEGKTLAVPAGMQPEGGSDHHYSFEDDAASGEYDFWKVTNLPVSSGSTLHVGTAGFCPWSGDGTACSDSNATNIAGSLGSISAADFTRGESNAQHGTFGQAISFAALCNDTTFVYPANASDGANSAGTPACSGHTAAHQRPPEGTRVYLDLSDEQVDALQLPAYAKAFWRTFDREHEGGFIADTDWSGAQGLTPAFQRDDFSQEAREAGVTPKPYAQVPLGLGTIDLARDIKFCTNGTC